MYNKDLFFLKNENTKVKSYVLSLHKIHDVPFPEAYLEKRLNRWVRKEIKTFNKEARLSIQHWKDSWHKRVYKINQRKFKDNPKECFFDYKIVKVVRITTEQQHRLDYMEQIIVIRDNDKPNSFSEADFKYLNKNDVEDMYYLYLNKKVDYRENKLRNYLMIFIRSCVIYKPHTGLIYLNNKEEKRFMYLIEIVKFCDATLERFLKEVKLKIFETKFWKKPPLLEREGVAMVEGKLKQNILEREKADVELMCRGKTFTTPSTLNDMMSNQFRITEENPNEPPRYMYNKDLFFLKNENIKVKSYVLSLHKIHAVPFPEAYLEERLNRWVRKEIKTFNKEAQLSIQHWKDSCHKRVYKINQRKFRDNPKEYFFDYKIVKVVRITTEQQHRLDYMEQIIVMRDNDKPNSFSEADFKYLNKNDVEDMYYLCLNKKVDYRENKLRNCLMIFIRSCVIYKPHTSLIYLNNKEEKRVMYLIEIVKFCDATLERFLKEVKLKIFETKFWKKQPLLDEKVGVVREWKTNSTSDEAPLIINS
nr:hypothetical protein [Tanacetum cinerariifolium]